MPCILLGFLFLKDNLTGKIEILKNDEIVFRFYKCVTICQHQYPILLGLVVDKVIHSYIYFGDFLIDTLSTIIEDYRRLHVNLKPPNKSGVFY